MHEFNTSTSDSETGPIGTEFRDGDRIDTSPDNLSENSISYAELKRRRLAKAATQVEAAKPEKLSHPELASRRLGQIGSNLALFRSEAA